MKKFPFRKLALILLISVFTLCFPAALSACGVTNAVMDFWFNAACNACYRSCRQSEFKISYELASNGEEYMVTKVGSEIEDVVIPETYEGKPVTIICDRSFSGYYGGSKLYNSLTLPSTIKKIQYGAFCMNGTSSFEKVYYNGTLDQYFDIDIGDRLLYRTKEFYINGEEIVDLVIPEGFAEVPQRVFAYYEGLRSVTLSQSVVAIGDNAFEYCDNLQSINISENLQSIGESAFYDCQNLSSELNFSKSLIYIGKNAFYNANKLSGVTFAEDTFTVIKDYAFANCQSITSLNIPHGVMLGYCSFYYCTSLKTLSIASTAAEGSFRSCASLSEVTFADSVKKIENSAFYNCSSLQILDLSKTNVQSIGISAFENCNLHIVYLPQTLENLSTNSFVNNPRLYEIYNLSQLNIRNHLSKITENAKAVHTSLSEPLQVECVDGWYFFYGEDETELFSCEEYALSEFPNSNIILPQTEQNYTLTKGVFNDVEILTVYIPSCVTAIGDYAFEGCAVHELTFSEGLVSIGKYAFSGCYDLNKIILPSTLTNFDAAWFERCKNISSITVHPDNPEFYAENNCVIDRESQILLLGCAYAEIPEGITAIGENAFNGRSIATVTVPEGVTTIGMRAFDSCKYLTDVYLPVTLKNIQSYAFSNCEALKSIALPERLESIGNYAFSHTGLIKISVPGNVSDIGWHTFYDCGELTEIRLSEGIEFFNFYSYDRCYNLQRLYLPKTFKISYLTVEFISELLHSDFTIHYAGTVEEWKKQASYLINQYVFTVHCSDGEIKYPLY